MTSSQYSSLSTSSRQWLKGGTSLKKCYIETWRFSEDLDFTVIPGGPDKPETIEPIIKRILERVHEESGIDFSIKPPTFKYFDKLPADVLPLLLRVNDPL